MLTGGAEIYRVVSQKQLDNPDAEPSGKSAPGRPVPIVLSATPATPKKPGCC